MSTCQSGGTHKKGLKLSLLENTVAIEELQKCCDELQNGGGGGGGGDTDNTVTKTIVLANGDFVTELEDGTQIPVEDNNTVMLTQAEADAAYDAA